MHTFEWVHFTVEWVEKVLVVVGALALGGLVLSVMGSKGKVTDNRTCMVINAWVLDIIAEPLVLKILVESIVMVHSDVSIVVRRQVVLVCSLLMVFVLCHLGVNFE